MFVFLYKGTAEDTPGPTEESRDITSPVRSFLERSKRQVEEYLRQKLSMIEELTEEIEDEGVMLDENSMASFHKLEDFLNPDNSAIKKLIEHRVLKNPTVLSELLEANFNDLLRVFRHLMHSDATSVESAYLHLLQLVEDDGAKGISKLASEISES